jgi:fatty-acid desaturase
MRTRSKEARRLESAQVALEFDVAASAQASNLPGLGLFTYGECWHNNHHAFPESARIGLDPGQADPGWWVLQQFAKRLGDIPRTAAR